MGLLFAGIYLIDVGLDRRDPSERGLHLVLLGLLPAMTLASILVTSALIALDTRRFSWNPRRAARGTDRS